MEVRTKRLAIRTVAALGATGFFALLATFLRASKDPFWERHFLDNVVLYWGSALAALPWFYLLDELHRRSWRDWIPAPLALLTGGLVYCLIFDLQRGRPWNSSISQLPESAYWFVLVPAAASAVLLVREYTRSSAAETLSRKDDVA
ncbi:MAG: hypothetical protein ACRD2L_15500, partial [Terriglobia bacterium]